MAAGIFKNMEEIRIQNVRPEIKEQLINIARHEEIQFGQFIRKKLTEIVNSYPEEKRKPMSKA